MDLNGTHALSTGIGLLLVIMIKLRRTDATYIYIYKYICKLCLWSNLVKVSYNEASIYFGEFVSCRWSA